MTDPAPSDPRLSAGDDFRPTVDLPADGLPGWLIGVVAAILALGLFLFLEGRRTNPADTAMPRSRLAMPSDPAPPLAIPLAPETQPSPRPAAVVMARLNPLPVPLRATFNPYSPGATQGFRPVPLPPANDVYAPPRFRTDTTPVAAAASAGAQTGGPLIVDLSTGKGASGEAADATDDAVRATVIHNRAAVVQQGVIISAVLETPLNSDHPGLARAVTSHDVRGFDGSRVLIPRGSRLIGEFKAENRPGLRRVLVNWTRLIRPDGVAIRIGSPATDGLGGAGVPGSVNTHFIERFASAVLQSALTIGVNLASQIPASGSNIYVGLPAQAAQLGQDLLPDAKRPATVKVRAGAEIAIFVAHDLDFGGTPTVH